MAKEVETQQFKLNLPADLRQRIESAAEQNRRSVTAEIIFTLEKAYPQPIGTDVEKVLDALAGVLNVVATTGDEAAIQQGIRVAEATLQSIGVTDRKFWYVNFHGDFIVMMTSKEDAAREWKDTEIAVHHVGKFADRLHKLKR